MEEQVRDLYFNSQNQNMTREEFLSENKKLMHDRAELEGARDRMAMNLEDLKKNAEKNKEKIAQQEKAVKDLSAKAEKISSEMKKNHDAFEKASKIGQSQTMQKIGEKAKNMRAVVEVVVALQGGAEKGQEFYKKMSEQKCVSVEQIKKEAKSEIGKKTSDEMQKLNEANDIEKEREKARQERERKMREFRENMKRKGKDGYEI